MLQREGINTVPSTIDQLYTPYTSTHCWNNFPLGHISVIWEKLLTSRYETAAVIKCGQ